MLNSLLNIDFFLVVLVRAASQPLNFDFFGTSSGNGSKTLQNPARVQTNIIEKQYRGDLFYRMCLGAYRAQYLIF